MKYRPYVQILLLLASMQVVSGYKFRCWFFCTDQTAVQNDYVEQRDECRKYAQLRLDTDTSNPELMNERNRASKLVALFSDCMSEKGWTVPDGKGSQTSANAPMPNPAAAEGARAAPPAPVVAPPSRAPMPMANSAAPIILTESEVAALEAKRREKTFLARSSDCAFARHGADLSSVAAARAQACDIECAQRLKAAPKGPRPAACPADPYAITPPK